MAVSNQKKNLFNPLSSNNSLVARLLAAGVDKDKTGQNGETPLHFAAWSGHAEVVKMLLEAGADKDKVDQNGGTPLLWAAENDHQEVMGMLLTAGVDKARANSFCSF